MGLIRLIVNAAISVLVGTFSKVAADEVKAWSPSIATRLLTLAVKRLPEADRKRYTEEWNSHVADTPGSVGKISVAFGFIFAAGRIRREQQIALADRVLITLCVPVIWLSMRAFRFINILWGKYAEGSPRPWWLRAGLKLCLRVAALETPMVMMMVRKSRAPGLRT